MRGPVRTVVYGLADPVQAREVGLLGVDAAIIAIGDEHPAGVDPQRAAEVAAALPPLTVKLVYLGEDTRMPRGFNGSVSEPSRDRPADSPTHLVRLRHSEAGAGFLGVAGVDAVWLRPSGDGSSSATRFDFDMISRLSIRYPTILEIPDGAAGIEPAVRLGRPYGVLLGEAAWFRPGILDLDQIESALAVTARLNKMLTGQALDA